MNYKDIKSVEDIKITTDYIPYIQKVSECKNVADITSHKEIAGKKVFVADSTTRHLFYIMKLVSLYTDIEFEDNEFVNAYDELNRNMYLDFLFEQREENGLIIPSAIPFTEIVEFKAIMDMVMDDMYENERSTTSILDNIKDAIGLVFSNISKDIENIIVDNNDIKVELEGNDQND